MRLEQGVGLPKQLRLVVLLHLVVVLVLVAISMAIWVPADEGRIVVARFFNAISGLYVLSVSGIYYSASKQNQVEDGTIKALALSVGLAVIAQFFANSLGVFLLWAANGWLMMLEATPSHQKRWPEPWLTARRQQGILLLVALTSSLVALYTRGYFYG